MDQLAKRILPTTLFLVASFTASIAFATTPPALRAMWVWTTPNNQSLVNFAQSLSGDFMRDYKVF